MQSGVCARQYPASRHEIFTQNYQKWVAMAAGAARLQAAQCRSLCYDKHHRWMVTVVMTLLIDSRVS